MNSKYISCLTLQVDRDLSELLGMELTREQGIVLERIMAIHYYEIIKKTNQLEGAYAKEKRTNSGTGNGV